jgi:hypothetical protein
MGVDKNTVILLRALVKLSSALYDIDELKEEKQFKYQLKKDLVEYQDWLEDYIKEPVMSLTKADDVLLLDLINLFCSYDQSVYVKDVFNTRINLLLAKCHSSINDLSNLDKKHSKYVNDLIIKTNNLVDKGYFKQYLDYKDPNGKTFTDIVKFMDDEGKSIIVGTL